MAQHSAYRLEAVLTSFGGTDHESSRNTRILAYSRDRDKLVRLEKLIAGEDSAYYKESVRFYNSREKYGVGSNPVYYVDLDGEKLPVSLIPVDDYYGRGSLSYYDIEEFDFPNENLFI